MPLHDNPERLDMDNNQDDPRSQKRYGTLKEWCGASGMGRTSVYQEIAAGNIRAIKRANRTLIDFLSGFAYLDSLPSIKIRRQSRPARKRPNDRPEELSSVNE